MNSKTKFTLIKEEADFAPLVAEWKKLKSMIEKFPKEFVNTKANVQKFSGQFDKILGGDEKSAAKLLNELADVVNLFTRFAEIWPNIKEMEGATDISAKEGGADEGKKTLVKNAILNQLKKPSTGKVKGVIDKVKNWVKKRIGSPVEDPLINSIRASFVEEVIALITKPQAETTKVGGAVPAPKKPTTAAAPAPGTPGTSLNELKKKFNRQVLTETLADVDEFIKNALAPVMTASVNLDDEIRGVSASPGTPGGGKGTAAGGGGEKEGGEDASKPGAARAKATSTIQIGLIDDIRDISALAEVGVKSIPGLYKTKFKEQVNGAGKAKLDEAKVMMKNAIIESVRAAMAASFEGDEAKRKKIEAIAIESFGNVGSRITEKIDEIFELK